MGGAEGKPAKFGDNGGRGGVDTVGESELCMLGAEGEPTAWTVDGAEGRPAIFGGGGGGGGVGTVGEPELRSAADGGVEKRLHHPPAQSQQALFSFFLPWSS